jgi:hypothetical protein
MYANFSELRQYEVRRIPLPRTRMNRLQSGAHLRIIAHSLLCVPLVGVSATRLDNASLQEAIYLKERRVNIVVRLLAESLVVVLLMAFGWWGMTTLGSDSLQAMRDPLYVARCPLTDTTLEKGSVGGSCSKEGVSHPITSRQPGVRLGEHGHGAERHHDDRVPPRTSENSPSSHFGE